MGAAEHLGISLAEYDARIRTFIPFYEEILDVAADAVASLIHTRRPRIVDLGIGTGALLEVVLRRVPSARVVGVDEDEGMLAAAVNRLGARLRITPGSFERAELPTCDAFVASLALHHIPTPAARLRVFRRLHRHLSADGVIVIADCYPASSPRLRVADRAMWLRHLEATYTPAQARGYLRAWAKEDYYVPLVDELALVRRAGFVADVYGRRGPFAVVVGTLAG
jgi:trans-aconitate methyltransferase